MKNIYRTIAVAGTNLLALGVTSGDATMLKPYLASSSSNSGGSNQVQAMTDGQMRAVEASHLEIYAGCKWGHAAFDPIKVESEELSPEVRLLHSQMV